MSVTASIRLRPKNIRKVLFALNIIAVIPILIISFFNVPAADDFSMAFEVHEAYASSGSVFAAIAEAIYMGYWYYMNWTGYFFSDALTALCPGIFDEGLYFLGTILHPPYPACRAAPNSLSSPLLRDHPHQRRCEYFYMTDKVCSQQLSP